MPIGIFQPQGISAQASGYRSFMKTKLHASIHRCARCFRDLSVIGAAAALAFVAIVPSTAPAHGVPTIHGVRPDSWLGTPGMLLQFPPEKPEIARQNTTQQI